MTSLDLARKSLDKRLASLRETQWATPPRGWLRAIREALGMTTTQMARRLGVSQPRIIALEKAEVSGAASIQTLREAAEALGCTLVYAIVPTTTLDAMVRARAAQRVEEDLDRLQHTMRLENQAVGEPDLEDQRRRLIDELLASSPRGLWQDP